MAHDDPAKRLTHPEPHASRLHVLVATPSEAFDLARKLEATPKLVARVVRGAKSGTAAALFDECAAALQLPPHFGSNWNALDDCLGDLDGDRLVVIFNEAQKLLAAAGPEAFATLVQLFGDPADAGGAQVVFQVEPGDEAAFEARLTRASAKFDRLKA